MVPRSSTVVVSPMPDSPELDEPADADVLPPLELVVSAATVSPVDPAGVVVITGVVEKPDESAVGP